MMQRYLEPPYGQTYPTLPYSKHLKRQESDGQNQKEPIRTYLKRPKMASLQSESRIMNSVNKANPKKDKNRALESLLVNHGDAEEEKQMLLAAMEREINNYRDNDDMRHSPIWIWFTKINAQSALCILCKMTVMCRHGSTTGPRMHLKRRHNSNASYDAWLLFEELVELKELRIDIKRQKEQNNNWSAPRAGKTPQQLAKKMMSPQTWKNSLLRGESKGLLHHEKEDEDREIVIWEGEEEDEEETMEEQNRNKDDEGASYIISSRDTTVPVKKEPGLENCDTNNLDFPNLVDQPNLDHPNLDQPNLDESAPAKRGRVSDPKAPVYINVGGNLYCTSMESLNKFPGSKLSKMFNGDSSSQIFYDEKENQYFIDREGKLFRYILNFCRSENTVLPQSAEDLDLLHQEACYFDIQSLKDAVQSKMRRLGRNPSTSANSANPSTSPSTSSNPPTSSNSTNISSPVSTSASEVDCAYLHVTRNSDSESVALSIRSTHLRNLFPEISSSTSFGLHSTAVLELDSSNQDFVNKFPIADHSKLNSLQVLQKLMLDDFKVTTSSMVGTEDGMITTTEYLLSKLVTIRPLDQ